MDCHHACSEPVPRRGLTAVPGQWGTLARFLGLRATSLGPEAARARLGVSREGNVFYRQDFQRLEVPLREKRRSKFSPALRRQPEKVKDILSKEWTKAEPWGSGEGGTGGRRGGTCVYTCVRERETESSK